MQLVNAKRVTCSDSGGCKQSLLFPHLCSSHLVTPWMNCRLPSSEVRFYTENGRFAFLSPLGKLGASYDDHLRLIGKRVVDFLLVLIELFSLGDTAEGLRTNIGLKSAISLQRGPVNLKFQVEGVAPTNHFSSQKTRLNILSYSIKIWTDLSSVLSQSTRLTDR